jgi:hypothetical protein
VKKTLDPREKKWMIAHMARPPDEKSDARWSPESAATIPDGSGAPRTLAMWMDLPRTTPRSQPRPDFANPAPYLERAPRTDNGQQTPIGPGRWAVQSPQTAPGRAPLGPLSVLPPSGNSVAEALGRRTRWGLWTFLAAMGVVVAAAAALPFLPSVPPALRPVRDAITGLTGLGAANAEVTADADAAGAAGHVARGPRIVPLPGAAPVMAAPPADPRLRRAAVVAAARAVRAPRGRAPVPPSAHERPALALAAPPPAPRPAATDPFEDAPGSASPRATGEARDDRPSRPVPVPAAVPSEREMPTPEAASPVREASAPQPRPALAVAPAREPLPPQPRPALAVAPAREAVAPHPAPVPGPAAPKPVPGSLDDLMANAVKNPPPAGKSELDKKLAGLDEVREEHEPRPKPQETPAVHSLTRSEIQSAMKAVQPKVSDCGRQFQASGAAELKVTVAEDGAVKLVNVIGVFAGTPTAECLARAVKSAVFPASAGLRFTYPLSLR